MNQDISLASLREYSNRSEEEKAALTIRILRARIIGRKQPCDAHQLELLPFGLYIPKTGDTQISLGLDPT